MSYNPKFNQRVIDLTVEQLVDFLASEVVLRTKLELENITPPSYSYKGIKGIQEIFQCSKSCCLLGK